MSKNLTREIGKGLVRLLWLGALAAWVVYGLYFVNFAPGQWFKLSPKPDDWGVFGDFVGGLLNPFFSFLAFIGVVFTVALQAKQLDVVREQATFEEIQRVLSGLSAQIDHLLATTPVIALDRYQGGVSNSQTVFEFVAALGTAALSRPASAEEDWLRSATADKHLAEIKERLRGELTTLGLELETLAWTLGRYAHDGGSEAVVDFYKYRYRAVIAWLDAAGLLDKHGQIQQVFEPKIARQLMADSMAPEKQR